MKLNEKENELVKNAFLKAKELCDITGNSTVHTVVAAVLSDKGNMYFGANCDSIHGTCAEVVAYVNSVLAGDNRLLTVVAVSVKKNFPNGVISPCGNCRQILIENTPNISVIICEDGCLKKIPIKKLIPNTYFK